MKVVFATHYSELYGANRSLLALIDGLQEYRVDSHVLVPERGPITEELSKRNIPFYALPFKQWMSRNRWKSPARLSLNFALLPLLIQKVRQWNVDLIHTNSSVSPIGALLAELLSLPHVWHVREFGERDFDLDYDWGEGLFQAFMSRANATIAVSEAVRRHVLADVSSPSYVVYNGVIEEARIERLSEKDKSTRRENTPCTFAIVGQISPAKGQKEALQALHRLRQKGREARLLVAGDGASEHVEALHHLCGSLGLKDHVSFLGYVSDPFEVYQQADAVLMCSPHEAMGRVTAEAMAAARPVIGYDSDGTAELIDDGHDGLLYDGSTEHLADCMSQFVNAPEWATSLGREGREKARREFTNEVYARQIYDVMQAVLRKENESGKLCDARS